LKRLYQALDIVNQSYGDNLALKNVRTDRGGNPQFTLTVKSSHAQGSRLGRPSGYTKEGKPKQRHIKSACWHAHRDFLRALFLLEPKATVTTALARYEGLQGFESKYPATGTGNVGSLLQPASYDSLCECGGGPSGSTGSCHLSRSDGEDDDEAWEPIDWYDETWEPIDWSYD
jgi:hypothetical protein